MTVVMDSNFIPINLFDMNSFVGPPAPSGFFPTPQQLAPIRSEITLPAPSFGLPRYTIPDAPSLAQTAAWASNNWMTSPYAAELSIRATPAAPVIGPPAPGSSPSFLDGFMQPWETMAETVSNAANYTFTEANRMLPGLLLERLGLIPERQTVNTQGDVEYHVYGTPGMAGATVPVANQEQPRGLFGIGYPSNAPAGVVPIGSPSVSSIGSIGIWPLIIFAGIFLLSRK